MTQYSSSGFPRTRQDKETHTDKKKSSALVVFDMERAPRWLNWVGEILSFWPWTNGLVEPARTCQARELINVTSQWHTCQGGTRTDNIINFVYLISAYFSLFQFIHSQRILLNQLKSIYFLSAELLNQPAYSCLTTSTCVCSSHQNSYRSTHPRRSSDMQQSLSGKCTTTGQPQSSVRYSYGRSVAS